MPPLDPAEHIDPADLALLALGELPDTDLAHLHICPECQAELASLRAITDLGRSAPPDLPDVPEHVWIGITVELGLAAGSGSAALSAATSESSRADAPGSGGADQPGPRPGPSPVHGISAVPQPPRASPSEAGPPATEPPPHASAGGATVIALPPRRRTAGLLAAAAAVGAIIGGAVVWAATDAGTTPSPTESVIAQAVLAPISDTVSITGKAEVLDTQDGLMVRIDARGLPPGSGFHEVWLLDSDGMKLVALGALPSGSVGTFTVPPGITIADFPVVDISIEPYDGDPAHSHNSLLRGVLEA